MIPQHGEMYRQTVEWTSRYRAGATLGLRPKRGGGWELRDSRDGIEKILALSDAESSLLMTLDKIHGVDQVVEYGYSRDLLRKTILSGWVLEDENRVLGLPNMPRSGFGRRELSRDQLLRAEDGTQGIMSHDVL